MEELRFGSYTAFLRKRASLTIRETASRLHISAAYLNDIEKGRRYPFSPEKIERFAAMVNAEESEKRRLYDLAAKDRGTVSEDVSRYLQSNSYIFAALRTAKELDANEDDWNEMLNELRKRKGV